MNDDDHLGMFRYPDTGCRGPLLAMLAFMLLALLTIAAGTLAWL